MIHSKDHFDSDLPPDTFSGRVVAIISGGGSLCMVLCKNVRVCDFDKVNPMSLVSCLHFKAGRHKILRRPLTQVTSHTHLQSHTRSHTGKLFRPCLTWNCPSSAQESRANTHSGRHERFGHCSQTTILALRCRHTSPFVLRVFALLVQVPPPCGLCAYKYSSKYPTCFCCQSEKYRLHKVKFHSQDKNK